MKKKLNLEAINITSFTTSIDTQGLKGGLMADSFDGVDCRTDWGGACPNTQAGALCSTEPQGVCSKIC